MIVLSVVGSFVLTTTQSNLSDFIWGHVPYHAWHDRLPFWPSYVADYVFNTTTLLVMLIALRELDPLGWCEPLS